MRLGYSRHRAAFHTLLPTLSPVYFRHAKNLIALMEFFIPVVTCLPNLQFFSGTGLWFGDKSIQVRREWEIASYGLHMLRYFRESLLSPCCGNDVAPHTISQKYLNVIFHLVGIQHPLMDVYSRNFRSCVGEDIELYNRGLSHASSGNRGRSEVDSIMFPTLLRRTP